MQGCGRTAARPSSEGDCAELGARLVGAGCCAGRPAARLQRPPALHPARPPARAPACPAAAKDFVALPQRVARSAAQHGEAGDALAAGSAGPGPNSMALLIIDRSMDMATPCMHPGGCGTLSVCVEGGEGVVGVVGN
jgi:hypothetical protein